MPADEQGFLGPTILDAKTQDKNDLLLRLAW